MSTIEQATATRVGTARRRRAVRRRVDPPRDHYDVFLSHNGVDKPNVERVARKLRAAGIEPWLDVWYLPGGTNWLEGLEVALRGCGAFAVFVGAHGLGDWQREELYVAEQRAAHDHAYRVIPVLLPGLPDPFDPSVVLPAFISSRTWVDLRVGVDDPVAFERLVDAINGTPSPPGPFPLPGDAAPYRGLEPFDEKDADLFLGRAADVQRLLEKLKSTHFLAILGPSGSGKSSLIRAGLLPALRHGRLKTSETWPIQIFKPGATPLSALAATLGDLPPGDASDAAVLQRRDLLQRTPDALHVLILNASRHSPDQQRTVLVIDQFEEIFTMCGDEAERHQFLANLLYAATVPGGRTTVVITLRADFYARCAAYPELASQMAAQQYLVAPINDAGLRLVIEQPANMAGYTLERGLVDAILADAGRAAGALPLLEQALLELWRRRTDHTLTLQAYQETGRVAGAVSQWAETVFSELTPDEQGLARRVMIWLVQPGDGTEDTRRRATIADLRTDSDSPAALENVVRRLVDSRLLTTGTEGPGGDQTVEITHEALIRNWPRLRSWIDEERAWLLLLDRLTAATRDWQQHGRDPSYLFGGARLLELEAHLAGHDTDLPLAEHEFWQASRAQAARDRAQAAAFARSRHLRSWGEIAGGAGGIAAGYGAAFTVPGWEAALRSVDGDVPSAVLLSSLVFLQWFAGNVFTGVTIGMALQFWAKHTLLRVAGATLGGAAVSMAFYLYLVRALGIGASGTTQLAVAGAALGGGLGLGAALLGTGRGRLVSTLLGGLLGIVLAKLAGGIPWDWPTVLVAGTLLGGLSSGGFLAATIGSEAKPRE